MAELDREAPAEVKIETSADATGAPLITVAGEVDISNAAALEEAVAAATARTPERLTFDLAGLRFMDSAGIAVLLAAANNVAAVRLRSPSPTVRRVVELTGLADVLVMEP